MTDLHGWQQDPFGRHEQRYVSQGRPTKLVRDGGVESYDPPPDSPPIPATPVSTDGQTTASVPVDPRAGTPVVLMHEPIGVPDHASMETTPLEANAAVGSPPPGWWLASDGNWYPPETNPHRSAPSPGWWLASDGNWYPPETNPDTASR